MLAEEYQWLDLCRRVAELLFWAHDLELDPERLGWLMSPGTLSISVDTNQTTRGSLDCC